MTKVSRATIVGIKKVITGDGATLWELHCLGCNHDYVTEKSEFMGQNVFTVWCTDCDYIVGETISCVCVKGKFVVLDID